jgi:hypothetical protein
VLPPAAAASWPGGGPRDPVRARGAGHDLMCDELVLELVCRSVGSETGCDAAWVSARLQALSALLGCALSDLARLGRAEALAALCVADDAVLARRLVTLRLALPARVDAGRFAAAAPALLHGGAAAEAARAGLGRAYTALAALFAPSPEALAALPRALLDAPELLANVPGVARALLHLRATHPAHADVALMLLDDTRLLDTTRS